LNSTLAEAGEGAANPAPEADSTANQTLTEQYPRSRIRRIMPLKVLSAWRLLGHVGPKCMPKAVSVKITRAEHSTR
jgi:hypothetical protein